MYNLIQEILPNLPLPIIDAFFEKIKQIPLARVDEKYITFLQKFTKEALKKRFDVTMNNFAQEQGSVIDQET